MTLLSGKWRNPELEAIRNSVKPLPLNDAHIEELIKKNKDIHISFLFGPEGKRLHDELCLTLSSTKQSPIYSGWEDFGYHLGINPQVINYLGLGLTREDPTYNIFRAFAYKENATIANVIEALKRIKRYDIIIKNCGLFIDLADEVHRKYRISEESGYLSLSEGTVESSNGCSEDDVQPTIIKSPYNFATGPNILKSHSAEVPERCAQINIQVHHEKQEQQLVRAAPRSNTRETSSTPKYGVKVMLTFASDGYEVAKAAAKIMREKRDGLPRIGVLILQEQLNALAQDDQLFISGSFNQVDYVIPIVTPQYLNRIINVENDDDADAYCVDAKYVRYIYTLMNTNFIKNGCLNKKCRCIIPNEFLHSILRHPLLSREPLFKVWKKLSETEELSRMLIRATLSKRKQKNFP
ncbi:uncharacterized protein [Hetaerina americana]|uniref:uncharacterized protein isoform X2 n=1 Tax=Hetaerina americana TaxID=62018 RepID=UPI003A7F35AB